MSQVRNYNESVSPQGGLSVKRSYRRFIVGLTALAVFFVSCKNTDPFVDPGDTPDPHWEVTIENDMTASMTGVVRVSFASNEGTLAAFMGNDCCGVADYIDGLYHLYISPANEGTNDQSQMSDVQLRFYSPDLKRIFVATEEIPFRNDANLGSIAEPYTPSWKAATVL